MDWDQNSYFYGFRLMLPILPSVMIFGLIFGITGYNTGLPLFLVSSMSYIIFAGSSQFLILILLDEGDPLIAIFIAAILINLRHIFYGASLHQDLKNTGKKKVLAAYLLTDEAFLITNFTYKLNNQTKIELKKIDVVIGGGGLLWLSWNLTTIIGFYIGQGTNILDGVATEFIVAGTFLGYLILQWNQSPFERKFIFSVVCLSFLLSFLISGVYLLFLIITLGMILAQYFFPLIRYQESMEVSE